MYRQRDYVMESLYYNDEPPPDYYLKQEQNDNESMDSDGKVKSFKRLCVRFAEKTSMQGIPYINAAKLWYAKLLWLLLLLGGIAGMTFHLYYLIAQYLAFEVHVSVTLGFNNLQFPAVTLCNVNAVRLGKIGNLSQQLQTFVEMTNPSKLKPKPHPPNPPPGGGIPPKGRRRKRFVDEFGTIDFENFTKQYDFGPGGLRETYSQIVDTFHALYMEESRSQRREAGHLLSDMLLQCSFDGYECFPRNFTVIQTEKNGNCYTLQSEDYVVTEPGPEKGLTLILYMENEEYLNGISQGYGARVHIHDMNTYPFPADEGLYVASSAETSIGLKQVEIERKSGLYGDCTDTSAYQATYGAKYTRTLCQVLCEQSLIIERCGCFDNAKSDIFKTLNTSSSDKPCRNDKEKKCLAEYKVYRRFKGIHCDQCTNPCSETQFVKSISARKWPNSEYANYFALSFAACCQALAFLKDDYQAVYRHTGCYLSKLVLMKSVCDRLPAEKCTRITSFSNDKYSLGQNFVKIVIYYEDLNYEYIQEQPQIEPQQFASDVGGAIGLWIGLSIISMFELVQLLMECCALGVHKCGHQKTSSTGEKYKQPTRFDKRRTEARQSKTNLHCQPYQDWKHQI